MVPSTLVFLDRRWEYDESIDHLAAVVQRGDVVATIPEWYGPLVDWRIGVREFGAAQPTAIRGLTGEHAIRLGANRPTGRVWVLWFTGDRRTFPGAEPLRARLVRRGDVRQLPGGTVELTRRLSMPLNRDGGSVDDPP